MYRRHVLWAEQENAEPIKFLFGNPTTHIRDVGGKIDDLEDFMVVDRGFVYGRQGGYTKHGVLLRTITNPAEVNRYATMFGQLYDRAQNVFQVLDLKITEANGNTDKQKKLSDLKSLCGYIKQKAGNKALYKTRFSEQQRHGRSFFDRVCELIATSKADIIAVDVADKKVSYFYRAWLKHDSYVKFREAGRKSVENGRKLKRLFILENKLEATHEDDIVKFLEAFLEDGATIGFLSKKNASNQFEDQPYSFKYELDFLLGGIPGEFITPGRAAATTSVRAMDADEDNFRGQLTKTSSFGFELFGNEPFVEEMLDWERNLVDTKGMWRKRQCFNKLWNAVPMDQKSNVVDKNDRIAIENEAARLKNVLLELNQTTTEA